MPTDAERYNLLLQALATGIEDIRQAFEMAFGVVLPSAATLNEELERIARAIYEAADRPQRQAHYPDPFCLPDRHMDERRQKHP
jgi:hypothetical protein